MLLMGLAIGGPWRTVQTEHFRLHYPIDAEAWALEASTQLESIRVRVSEEVGTNFSRVVDIVVQDPFTRANGYAIPRKRSPRMGIFGSPPYADSILGSYRSWEEDLIVHEDAHLVHLMIPSRNPVGKTLVDWSLMSGPVARKSPRWVAEGYATVVEGRLTGFGRPNGDGRSTVLRTLARSGQMPTYGQLDGADRWMGGSMAYLVGSAYLEWLELEHGEGTLKELWMAMSARTFRSFDDAFSHVFGESPAAGYKRYTAELTRDALDLEEDRIPMADTLFQDLSWTTGAPAVSPDGMQLAIVQRDSFKQPRLLVLPIEDDGTAREEWLEAQAERLEKDPLDAPGVEPEVFAREAVHTRIRPDRAPSEPRWLPDGSGLIFTSFMQVGEFEWVPDLVVWDFEEGERQVTQRAAIRDADVHPNGEWAVAVRQRWSVSQLVEVNLETGEWNGLTEPTVDIVYDSPRISPDGSTVAYVANAGEGWKLMLRDLETGAERMVETPDGALVSHPSWGDDGLYASVGIGGFVEAWHFPIEGGWRVCTRTTGGAFSPEPDGAGGLFYLSMDTAGLDLHHVAEPGNYIEHLREGLAVRPTPPPPIALPDRAEVEPKAYRGRPGPNFIAGASVGKGDSSSALGLRLGDVAGQYEGAILWGGGGWGLQGGWYRLPVEVHGYGWSIDDELGGAVHLENTHTWNTGSMRVAAGGFSNETPGGFAELGVDHRHWMGRWNVGAEAWTQAFSTDTSVRAGAGLDGGFGPIGLYAAGEWGRTDGLYKLGGQHHVLVPDHARPDVLVRPDLAPSSAVGSQHRMWEAGLNSPLGMTLGYKRHTLDGSVTFGKQSVSGVTLAMDVQTPRQSVFRVSRADVQLGVGCILERPVEGYVGCGEADSWTAWSSVVWSL
jgi:hypothetical protein